MQEESLTQSLLMEDHPTLPLQLPKLYQGLLSCSHSAVPSLLPELPGRKKQGVSEALETQ
jgi:hypothetical protein